MTKGIIHPSPIPPKMGFGEFLRRLIQTDVAEFDRALKGTSPLIFRSVRKKQVAKRKRKQKK